MRLVANQVVCAAAEGSRSVPFLNIMGKQQRHKNPLQASTDLAPDVRRQYWRGLADFWFSAASLEAKRCGDDSSTGESRMIDLNFFVVACQRLRNVAVAMKRELPESAEALAAFDHRWPQLANLRHIQEHISYPERDPERGLFGVTYFGEFIANLKPEGEVEYLIDTRWNEALTAFHGALIRMLEESKGGAEQALAADRNQPASHR